MELDFIVCPVYRLFLFMCTRLVKLRIGLIDLMVWCPYMGILYCLN